MMAVHNYKKKKKEEGEKKKKEKVGKLYTCLYWFLTRISSLWEIMIYSLFYHD
jgi:hypothetical protein